MKSKINITKVFVNEKGKFGNPVGIVIDNEEKLDQVERQKIAAQLNFSETIFIHNLVSPRAHIHNPLSDMDFSGYAVLGAAYFLKHSLGKKCDSIKCGSMDVNISEAGILTFVEAPLSIMPPWNFQQLESAEAVEKLKSEDYLKQKHIVVWAWINRAKKIIRARTFATDWGIPEDEANGSGSMVLAFNLHCGIKIIHGQGSEIYAQIMGNNMVKLGGRVTLL